MKNFQHSRGVVKKLSFPFPESECFCVNYSFRNFISIYYVGKFFCTLILNAKGRMSNLEFFPCFSTCGLQIFPGCIFLASFFHKVILYVRTWCGELKDHVESSQEISSYSVIRRLRQFSSKLFYHITDKQTFSNCLKIFGGKNENLWAYCKPRCRKYF